MNVFMLLLIAPVVCAMQMAMTAAPDFTLAPITTQTGAVQLPMSTTWFDRTHVVPLMDNPEKMLCMIPNFWADHRTSIRNGIDYLNNHGGGVI